ncbi:putative bifunctional diguanylate cyclase/phosphodiesterase [Sulfurirhabdus autotrophica]|uniref:Diguanylate cyclase (GGDEF)-like protein n=1 Tax=Sulfurirhabdus autotrophica TaxID=1706046 RepID=A0A4R3XUP5_9PROT|nr:EAL domain-containing protein [Sulfurirhabdus autotrophica]TCV81104.1 diguanylate cyclase (GGDEF)-like protein [Sulfurirhabdus autotrophica]
MARTSQILSGNARLLKSKVSKYAVVGTVISIAAILVATAIMSFLQVGSVTIDSMMSAQQTNPSLWMLDAMPFLFAFWGQYVSSIMAFEASAMVVDQTHELRTQTTILANQAMRSSTYDALTDLPNRVLLRDRLEQALNVASRDKTHLAILIMDLDRFKDVNDTLGHYIGDRILKQVAKRLQGVIQEPNSVARLGGDEFAVLLPKIADIKDATLVVSKIEKALHAPFMIEGLKLDIQASVGVAFFPEHGMDADTLLQRADVAMYVAKKNHSGFVVYSQKLDQHSPHRLTLMGELRQAIDRDELVLHYQPKINVKTAMVSGVEALVRWNHGVHGLMPPDDFIPLAERTGLIKPLTLWVLNHALQQCAVWQEQGLKLDISVNVSANGLMDLDLPDTVAGLLASHEVAPERLVLEITESAIMLDKDRAMQVLTSLAGMGIRLSIDDFGTGYSSLAYLSKMPVKEIKIDKSFVMDMEKNSSNAMIVHATIDLGHNLGLEVIGEGVESKEIMAKLKGLGCDVVQGFHFTKPLAEAQFSEWLSKSINSGLIKTDGGQTTK